MPGAQSNISEHCLYLSSKFLAHIIIKWIHKDGVFYYSICENEEQMDITLTLIFAFNRIVCIYWQNLFLTESRQEHPVPSSLCVCQSDQQLRETRHHARDDRAGQVLQTACTRRSRKGKGYIINYYIKMKIKFKNEFLLLHVYHSSIFTKRLLISLKKSPWPINLFSEAFQMIYMGSFYIIIFSFARGSSFSCVCFSWLCTLLLQWLIWLFPGQTWTCEREGP